MQGIDEKFLYKKFRKWREYLTRAQGSILTQIRSRHLPTNTYLKRFKKREDNYCNNCLKNTNRMIPNTTNHYILDYLAYDEERDNLKRKIGRVNTVDLERLFKTEKGMRELLNYLDATGRFNQIIGRLRILQDQTSYQEEKKQKKTQWRKGTQD